MQEQALTEAFPDFSLGFVLSESPIDESNTSGNTYLDNSQPIPDIRAHSCNVSTTWKE